MTFHPPKLKPGNAGRFIQRKLTIGQPDDQYEKEADAMADQVMQMPQTPLPIQRKKEDREEEQLQMKPLSESITPIIQKQSEEEEEEVLQMKGFETGHIQTKKSEASPDISTSLSQTKGSGSKLPEQTNQFMSNAFGADFSNVSIHTNSNAIQMNRSLGARAFTHGNDVYFNEGEYNPTSKKGKHLLAHELTHTIQQKGSQKIQRALKFELQTGNYVWQVDNILKSQTPEVYKPYAKPLPRKYGPRGVTEEDGSKPAYLALGHTGAPAKPKGTTSFVEPKGALVMKEAKKGIDDTKPAQFFQVYKFNTQVKIEDIIDKPVALNQLDLFYEMDKSELLADGDFNPNTFEFQYFNADKKKLEVHLNEDRVFKNGHVKYMKVGREKRDDIKKKKDAQYVETWKVSDDPQGTIDMLGKKVKIELISTVDNSKLTGMKGMYNLNTWEKRYFKADDFEGDKLKETAASLDLHIDKNGDLKTGHIKFLEKTAPSTEAKEQTAMEAQSESGGFLEFETPKWFRSWSELEVRIQEAIDMTKAIDVSKELKSIPADTEDAKILEDMQAKAKAQKRTLGRVVEWPSTYSTSHLKALGNRRLLVEIVNDNWPARIQASEGTRLENVNELHQEHAGIGRAAAYNFITDNIFKPAFAKAKAADNNINESLFVDLHGFLQLIVSYIFAAQTMDGTGKYSKSLFGVMARSNFGSMHTHLLSDVEKSLFNTLVTDPSNPILTELEGPINIARSKAEDKQKSKELPPEDRKLDPLTLTRESNFFFRKVGTDSGKATFGPKIYDWLYNITKGKDLLSGPGISAAMGAKQVETDPTDKDYELALFEIRGTKSHGGTDQNRSGWMTYVKNIFDSAMSRSSNTADDPTTPGTNEASKTVLKK